MDDQTILICDDDDAIRRLIGTILSRDGHRTRTSVDVPSAIAALTEQIPALVILDLGIPGDGGGMSVLHHIRERSEFDDVRVLLVTGAAQAYDAGWGVSVGADGHLAKPFELQGLRDAVRDVLT